MIEDRVSSCLCTCHWYMLLLARIFTVSAAASLDAKKCMVLSAQKIVCLSAYYVHSSVCACGLCMSVAVCCACISACCCPLAFLHCPCARAAVTMATYNTECTANNVRHAYYVHSCVCACMWTAHVAVCAHTSVHAAARMHVYIMCSYCCRCIQCGVHNKEYACVLCA